LAEAKRKLLTIGVFFIVVVVAILLFAANVISWTLIIPVVLVLFGIWMLALATMRNANPQKYERDVFSTISMGVLLIAVGGAWYLFPINWLYSLVLILLLLGAVAIAAAMRRK
jgi:hypothetical protein